MSGIELYNKYAKRIENIQLKSLDLINNCGTNKGVVDILGKTCIEMLLNVYEEIAYVYINSCHDYDYDYFRNCVNTLQKGCIKNIKNLYPDKFAKYLMLNEYLNEY